MTSGQLARIKPRARVDSLDIMRGFSMFWLIGGAAIVGEFALHSSIGGLDGLAMQMKHASWVGLRFFDLIFPFFIFASGATIPYSILRMKEKGVSNFKIAFKALRRALILSFIGVMYNEWTSHDFANPRLCSVLAQIGISYFICIIIYLVSPRSNRLLASAIGIMLLIAGLQILMPGSSLSEEIYPGNNINSLIDSALLPGRLLNGTFDPEGPLNWISASALCLIGAWTSNQLAPIQERNLRFRRKLILPFVIGVMLILVGLIADSRYSIIKALWTSSFCAVAGGISILFYLALYAIVDVKNIKKPFYLFKVIGSNSLLAYLATRLFGYAQFTNALGGYASRSFSIETNFLVIIFTTFTTFSLLYFLYRKKIFIKV
jgi:predicted acyltransferase